MNYTEIVLSRHYSKNLTLHL